jgi:nucleotide sugar dehydrogenase
MIGIIGYGMVGQAVEYGFSKTKVFVCDPKYNHVTVKGLCLLNPEAIFVCVPTPTDDTNYSLVTSVLNEIFEMNYQGIVIVKSTILPQYLEKYDIVYNPEFLSRSTSKEDFVNPHLLILSGKKSQQALELYKKYSTVDTENTVVTDINTASFIKYTMNSFYATKVIFMNSMYEVAKKMGVDYNEAITILSKHPWMGTNHFRVPGPDGKRGFGGPCLPKDTECLVKNYDVELLKKVLDLNQYYRNVK